MNQNKKIKIKYIYVKQFKVSTEFFNCIGFFLSYCNVKWGVSYWLILPSGEVATRRVCYQLGYLA